MFYIYARIYGTPYYAGEKFTSLHAAVNRANELQASPADHKRFSERSPVVFVVYDSDNPRYFANTRNSQ